ncbi:MAG: hypothetical protein ABI949_09155 [Ilumatobacteraceae bacterium]
MERFELKLVRAEREHHRIVIGLDVDRDGEHFQYFECWASRVGDIAFGDRQKLVAAAVAAVSDRVAGHLVPLADPREAIIVPIQSHPNPSFVGPAIADALLDLAADDGPDAGGPVVHTIDTPVKPTLT